MSALVYIYIQGGVSTNVRERHKHKNIERKRGDKREIHTRVHAPAVVESICNAKRRGAEIARPSVRILHAETTLTELAKLSLVVPATFGHTY